MIDPKELRIGNWVYYNGKDEDSVWAAGPGIKQVEDIFNECGINHAHTGIVMFAEEYLEPIQLTPEILEAAGFERVGASIRISVNSADELTWYDQDAFLRLQTKGAGFTRVLKIKSLHQLQNLYFALTGQELVVNFLVNQSDVGIEGALKPLVPEGMVGISLREAHKKNLL